MTIDLTPNESKLILDAIRHSIYDTQDLLDSGILDSDPNKELEIYRQQAEKIAKLKVLKDKFLEFALQA